MSFREVVNSCVRDDVQTGGQQNYVLKIRKLLLVNDDVILFKWHEVHHEMRVLLPSTKMK